MGDDRRPHLRVLAKPSTHPAATLPVLPYTALIDHFETSETGMGHFLLLPRGRQCLVRKSSPRQRLRSLFFSKNRPWQQHTVQAVKLVALRAERVVAGADGSQKRKKVAKKQKDVHVTNMHTAQ